MVQNDEAVFDAKCMCLFFFELRVRLMLFNPIQLMILSRPSWYSMLILHLHCVLGVRSCQHWPL